MKCVVAGTAHERLFAGTPDQDVVALSAIQGLPGDASDGLGQFRRQPAVMMI
jgi:hypothetical protein